MGMYDTITAKSPCCGFPLAFQSKSGGCDLRDYPLEEAPPETLPGIKDDIERCKCGIGYRVQVVYLALVRATT